MIRLAPICRQQEPLDFDNIWGWGDSYPPRWRSYEDSDEGGNEDDTVVADDEEVEETEGSAET
jgi:hypothetical protein